MTTYNSKKFAAVYERKLLEAIEKDPKEYGYPKEQVPMIVAKMVQALAVQGANTTGRAIKATTRELGIPHTLKGIADYLAGDFKLVRNADKPNYWDLVSPCGTVEFSGEPHSRVNAVLCAIHAGAVGCTEADEVAARILEVRG